VSRQALRESAGAADSSELSLESTAKALLLLPPEGVDSTTLGWILVQLATASHLVLVRVAAAGLLLVITSFTGEGLRLLWHGIGCAGEGGGGGGLTRHKGGSPRSSAGEAALLRGLRLRPPCTFSQRDDCGDS
jgi:hypothetical protein